MAENKQMQLQLRRIRGQVEGIEKMIGSGRDCEAVLTQISAATSSLKAVARQLLATEAVRCAGSSNEKANYASLLKRFF